MMMMIRQMIKRKRKRTMTMTMMKTTKMQIKLFMALTTAGKVTTSTSAVKL